MLPFHPPKKARKGPPTRAKGSLPKEWKAWRAENRKSGFGIHILNSYPLVCLKLLATTRKFRIESQSISPRKRASYGHDQLKITAISLDLNQRVTFPFSGSIVVCRPPHYSPPRIQGEYRPRETLMRFKNDASLAVWNMDEHYVIPRTDPTGRSVIWGLRNHMENVSFHFSWATYFSETREKSDFPPFSQIVDGLTPLGYFE